MDTAHLHILKMSNLPDYFVRMIREQENLKERIDTLDKYIAKTELATVDGMLLRLQSNAMRNYEGVLSLRIIKAIDEILDLMKAMKEECKAKDARTLEQVKDEFEKYMSPTQRYEGKDANAEPAPTKTAE